MAAFLLHSNTRVTLLFYLPPKKPYDSSTSVTSSFLHISVFFKRYDPAEKSIGQEAAGNIILTAVPTIWLLCAWNSNILMNARSKHLAGPELGTV